MKEIVRREGKTMEDVETIVAGKVVSCQRKLR